jgi:hypothetical protein
MSTRLNRFSRAPEVVLSIAFLGVLVLYLGAASTFA